MDTDKMTFSELQSYFKELENYLSLALVDSETICQNPAKELTKVCNFYKQEFYYEHNIKNLLKDKDLNKFTNLDLQIIMKTHPYKTGMWEWRYAQKVKQLMKSEKFVKT